MAALLLSSLTVSAHDFVVGGICYNITSYSDWTVAVTYREINYDSYFNKYSGAVTIPSTVTYNSITYNVTSIGDDAFEGCTGLTAITIPKGVTSIGERAFFGCSSLTAITLPASVTSIGYDAFSGCTSLTTINVAEGNANYDSRGGCNAIIETGSNTLIVGCAATIIPEGVTSIGGRAFLECSSLTAITIPESMTSIGELAFAGCSSITTITIPEGVTSIGNGAFAGCSSITTINVAEGNANYDSRGGCNAIIETGSNTLIAGCAATIIPEGVTSIGAYAFEGCLNLATITIPESVTSIGVFAFRGCKFSSITIPEGVTSIGDWAFAFCSSLTAITLPEGVTSIGEDAFDGCSSLTTITIPESVTSIGRSAFLECTSLTSITIPESVTSIGAGAFSGTAWYDNQPDGVIYAGNVLYKYKGDMPENTTIEVKEGVVSIAAVAFSYCSNLTSITVPESVTSIEYAAFSGCSNLTSITLPESVTSIGDNAFENCRSLTSITLPEGVTEIGAETFIFCISLTTITIPESVTSIGDYAFEHCSNLKVVKNFSNLNIVKGSKNHGYVAYYADVVITKGLFLDFTELILTAGESATLTATIVPEENCTVEWSSSDNDVAVVDNQGKVTAVATGTAIITAKAGEKMATCEVIVQAIPVSGITLNYTTVELAVGETLRLVATVTPDNAADKTVTWSSSNASVVSVDENGNVTVLKYGRTVTITATAGDCTARCTVKVNKAIEVEGVALSQTIANLFVGETLTLIAAVTPDNATNKTITWATSNNSVAAVDSNGVITAIAEGTATITAKAGDKEAICVVTVSIPDSIEKSTVDKSQLVIYDLHGRRVENPEKGIYIVGGKKVAIK